METRQCRIEEHGVERNKRHWFKEFKKRIDDDDEKSNLSITDNGEGKQSGRYLEILVVRRRKKNYCTWEAENLKRHAAAHSASNIYVQCELNKPICKRKAMAQKGSFEKKSCPTMQKRNCALAQPKCPLLPDEGQDCPIAKLVDDGKKGEKVCPLAPQGCPCDPCPPCPLAFEDVQIDDEESKEQTKVTSEKLVVPCPAMFPAFGKCPKTVDSGGKNLQMSCCSNVLGKDQDPGASSLEEEIKKPYTPGAPLPELLQSIEGLKAHVDSTPELTKKALTVPDCTLASRRPLPCSKCLGDLLTTPNLKINPKDCPYLKLIDMCDNTCLCEDVPSIDLGPPCPFAPKPCPCCAVVRCPLSRQPDCPLVSREPKPKCEPPPKCKCYCPIVPPSCASGMPITCKMHNNIKPAPSPKCKCSCTCAPPTTTSPCRCSCSCEQEERPKCPLVPTSFAECPLLQPSNQSSPFTGMKPTQPLVPLTTTTTRKSKIPNVLVPPNVINSLENTLEELNKICTCDHPPSPQMVNMIPTTAIPSKSKPIAVCIASGEHDNCPIECLCEPPRTFHVPDCPKKNPCCLRSPPKGNKKGDMVCPFSPRCCPLGRVCPFPVAAGEATVSNSAGSKTVSNLPEEQTFMSSWCKEKDAAQPKATPTGRLDTLVNQIKSGLDICTMIAQPKATSPDKLGTLVNQTKSGIDKIGGSTSSKSDEKPNLPTSQTMMHDAQSNQFKQTNLPLSQNGRQEQMNKGAADETPSNCPLSKINNGRDAKKKVVECLKDINLEDLGTNIIILKKNFVN
uniref:Uncharacterized protein n=1 Tax=Rhodnius prolixus TaxID=13249 RepID=T1HVW0_RHOPR